LTSCMRSSSSSTVHACCMVRGRGKARGRSRGRGRGRGRVTLRMRLRLGLGHGVRLGGVSKSLMLAEEAGWGLQLTSG